MDRPPLNRLATPAATSNRRNPSLMPALLMPPVSLKLDYALHPRAAIPEDLATLVRLAMPLREALHTPFGAIEATNWKSPPASNRSRTCPWQLGKDTGSINISQQSTNPLESWTWSDGRDGERAGRRHG